MNERKLKDLFKGLNIGFTIKYPKKIKLFEYEDLNIEALRNFKGELVIVATNIDNVDAIKLYKKR